MTYIRTLKICSPGSKENSKNYITFTFEQIVKGNKGVIDTILWAIGLLLCSVFQGIIDDQEGTIIKKIWEWWKIVVDKCSGFLGKKMTAVCKMEWLPKGFLTFEDLLAFVRIVLKFGMCHLQCKTKSMASSSASTASTMSTALLELKNHGIDLPPFPTFDDADKGNKDSSSHSKDSSSHSFHGAFSPRLGSFTEKYSTMHDFHSEHHTSFFQSGAGNSSDINTGAAADDAADDAELLGMNRNLLQTYVANSTAFEVGSSQE
jgi:hypothetical protein